MSQSQQKIVQYLNEAHAAEVGLVRVLQSQIAMTPRGSYRSGLEKHLGETHRHAQRVQRRLDELDAGAGRLQSALGAVGSTVGQALALTKTPFDLLRGSGGEEKVLKNAKDAAATEALEIATYTAIERLAGKVGDKETARLAKGIRREEERMAGFLQKLIPQLVNDVAKTEIPAEFRRNGSRARRRTTSRPGTVSGRRAAGSASRSSSRSASRSSSRSATSRSSSSRSGSRTRSSGA